MLLLLMRRPTVLIRNEHNDAADASNLTQSPAREIFLEMKRRMTNMVGKMIKAIIDRMIRCP